MIEINPEDRHKPDFPSEEISFTAEERESAQRGSAVLYVVSALPAEARGTVYASSNVTS